jgi:hypothetical protein
MKLESTAPSPTKAVMLNITPALAGSTKRVKASTGPEVCNRG